jgi:pyridoxamine 5'-phosphate oxidase family protein
MGRFQDNELSFLLGGRRLARVATVGRDGTPHVVPVGWSYNREVDAIEVGGHELTATKKYRDVARSGRAAIVIDEVLPPWNPRGIEVRGSAEAIEGPPALIRIHPDQVRSWGLDAEG